MRAHRQKTDLDPSNTAPFPNPFALWKLDQPGVVSVKSTASDPNAVLASCEQKPIRCIGDRRKPGKEVFDIGVAECRRDRVFSKPAIPATASANASAVASLAEFHSKPVTSPTTR
jgi:hypothetical protein